MIDERPVRCYVHPNLKHTLENLNKRLNEESIKQTHYPIPNGLPITSEIASKILNKILEDKDTLITAKKVNKNTFLDIDVFEKLKEPVVFLISNNWNNLSNRVKDYLNLELHKMIGIKKNEIMFW